jgi:hypothetical protein
MKYNFYKKSKSIASLVIITMALSFASCNKSIDIFDLDINTDPNSPTIGSAELLLPEAQRNMAAFMEGLNNTQQGFMGVISSSDSYGLGANSFYGSWSYFYTGPGKDLEEVIIAAKAKDNKPYLGIAQAMKAYSFSTMVDLFGTVPFSEAFLGNAAAININPKFDDGKTIYTECYKLLDSAILNLTAASPYTVTGDIMYGGSKASWIRFANTVRLRMLMTSRKVNTSASSQIQAALKPTGGIIESPSQDFTWKYGGQISPDLRHPWFTAAYLANNNFTYIGVQYMFDMLLRKDPRLPFYFRRQYDKILDQSNPTDRGATPVQGAYLVLNPDAWTKARAAGVLADTKADSAYFAGYFGRFRGDQSGVSEDVRYRMVPGVYPAAGLFDNRANAPYVLNTKSNSGGAGIFPMITSNMVNFWKAEAELAYGFGDPKATAEKAIRESMKTVNDFGVSKDASSIAMKSADIDAYVTNFLTTYDAAATDEVKLNKVLYEAYFAQWGSGFEMYNAFRRTGYPSNLATPITLNSQFALRLPIPVSEGTLNPNAPKPLPIYYNDPVFWDILKFKF